MSLKKPTSTEAKINWLCSERAIAEAEAATIEAMASFLGMKVLLPPYYLLILVLYTYYKASILTTTETPSVVFAISVFCGRYFLEGFQADN